MNDVIIANLRDLSALFLDQEYNCGIKRLRSSYFIVVCPI